MAQTLTQQVDRDLKWLLFSFDGRATRSEYWKGTLFLFLAYFVAAMVIVLASIATGGGASADSLNMVTYVVIGTVALVLGVPAVWASFAIAVKRWHDRGKSGLWVLIAFIPYIGSLWVLIECGCLRGTIGANAYGPDPLA